MSRVVLGRPPQQQAPTKRLVLEAVEVAVLVATAGVALPPGFLELAEPVAAGVTEMDPHLAAEATERLVERGVLQRTDSGVAVVPSVLANLLVFSLAQASVSVEGSRGAGSHGAGTRGEGTLKAWFSVRDGLGASLFALPAGAVELSVYPAVALGVELVRAVPPLPLPEASSRLNVGVEPPDPEPGELAGRYPLDGLAAPSGDLAAAFPAAGRSQALSPDARDRLDRARALIDGNLRFLCLGRDTTGVLATPVLWLSAAGTWYAAAPVEPTGDERAVGLDRVVDLVPVRREDIGTWLAPGIALALEVGRG